MYILDGNLEAIKKLGFGVLYLGYKVLGQVFVHNSVTGGKKGQNVGDKMALPVIQVGPIAQIVA